MRTRPRATAPGGRRQGSNGGSLAAAGFDRDGLDRDAFDRDGFVRLGVLLSPGEIDQALSTLRDRVGQARHHLRSGDKVSGGTLHLGLDPTDTVLPRIWEHPLVLSAVHHHLGDDAVLDRVTYRAPKPGHGGQTLHVDHAGFVAPGHWKGCNALVALVDVTGSSGATRVVPGSHLDPDPRFQARSPSDRHPGERHLTGPAGTVFVFSPHILHSGTSNQSDSVRHALLINWGARD